MHITVLTITDPQLIVNLSPTSLPRTFTIRSRVCDQSDNSILRGPSYIPHFQLPTMLNARRTYEDDQVPCYCFVVFAWLTLPSSRS
ncbi:hypothetical protein BJX99DRAFT_59776 [Aspergillus californicus]